MERDNQETWALHGVYPGYAWTPDGESIVYWAKGKIRRIEIDSAESSVIPFRVTDERRVAGNLRFPVDPAPGSVSVRVLRWPVVSPDATRVVYQALGSLWIRDLDSGDTRRLTDEDERYEFHPAWSRDGTRVVYTTWHDEELGAVRVRDVETGVSWRVTGEPGHYANPVFSPDGERVVYEKHSGGWLTSPLWSEETGLYVASAGSGEGAANGRGDRVASRGRLPQFGSDGDRVYFILSDFADETDNTKLMSVALDGRAEQREHLTSDWATEYRISPDGTHVAFAERFKVYVAPLVPNGRSVKVSPTSKAVPIAQVSTTAGEYLSWGADSDRLYWSLGPTLYECAPREALAPRPGGSDDGTTGPSARGVDIGFEVPHDVPDATVAIVGGRLITMGGDDFEVIENGTVVIEGNRITMVGERRDVDVPDDAFVIQAAGRTVLPGFFEAHGHGAMATTPGITPQQNWVNWVRLAFGVTSIHDPSNNTNAVFASSEMTMTHNNVGPRTFSTGTILYGASGSFKAIVDSYEDALFQLERMRAKGAWSVKSYNQPRRDQRQQIVEAARELGMQVVPEGGATFMHNMTMIVDGHTGIEHTLPVETFYDDVAQLWVGTNVGMTPTLSVAYGGLGGDMYWYHVDDVWKDPRVAAFVPPNIVEPRSKRRQKAPEGEYNHIASAAMCKKLVDLGINVQPGGHGQLQGLNTHWELWMMVQGGMTNHEALRAGTLSAARHFSMDKDLGSIEPGKLADLVILEPGADPLVDIRDTDDIEWVIANGRVYESRTMNQLSPAFVERQPFFWELDGFDGRIGTPPVGSECLGCGAPGIAHWHTDIHGDVVPCHDERHAH